jgi:hypothetical protein
VKKEVKMFFEIITLLLLIALIVLTLLLSRKIPDDVTLQMIAKTNRIATRALDTAQVYIDSQKNVDKIFLRLDDKMDALSRFVDTHSTRVAFQQEQFDALAKADVSSARREELLRCKELKIALERLMGVALTSRQPPSPNDILALENLTKRIKELEDILKET